MRNDFIGTVGVDVFVVEACEERAAVNIPELVLDGIDTGGLIRLAFCNTSNDIHPRYNSPQAIFLANMVATRAERFFPADREFLGVEECAEEFPSRRHLITF